MLFSHYGDFGDVIYSLAAVQDLCDEVGEAARFCLYPHHGTRAVMTKERADVILPLLLSQPYLLSASWRPGPVGVRLDTALQKFGVPEYNIADRVNHYLNIPHSDRTKPWLHVSPRHEAPVVFSRSSRHRPPGFPWRRIVSELGQQAVFVGLDDEYRAFVSEVAPGIRHCQTTDLLDVARIIAGCQLFVGNQSAPRAIAEGLKVRVVVEQSDRLPDTHWDRPGAWYGSSESFWCPALDRGAS